MEKRKFGNTDMNVSVLGFGGAEIGAEHVDLSKVERLLSEALDAGLNLIDTAECYGDSEEKIGRTIAHRRHEYYLFTKVGHAHGEGLDSREHWDPAMMADSIDRSLRRLKSDYVDMIHLHSCSEEQLRQGDVIEVLLKAKKAGKTRYIGYSGENDAALYAVQTGLFDSLQTSVNIADQHGIQRILPEAVERNMGIVAKRPIANVAWKDGRKPDSAYAHEYWHRLEQLQFDFLRDPLDESLATALRFTLTVPGVCTAITGTAKPEHWQKNAQLAAGGKLPESLYESIRARWNELAPSDWIGQV